jgi:hypothetical protein
MRLRRRHRDDWWLPSGLAEVELFRFWEADLGLDETVIPAARPVEEPRRPVDEPRRPPARGTDPSLAPLWCGAWLVVLVIVVALLV